MLLRLLVVIGILILTALVLWIIHACTLLPIRSGPTESIRIVVSVFGEASALEMQLRGLIWLRDNGILPCSLYVEDYGLNADALAVLLCFAAEHNITVISANADANG